MNEDLAAKLQLIILSAGGTTGLWALVALTWIAVKRLHAWWTHVPPPEPVSEKAQTILDLISQGATAWEQVTVSSSSWLRHRITGVLLTIYRNDTHVQLPGGSSVSRYLTPVDNKAVHNAAVALQSDIDELQALVEEHSALDALHKIANALKLDRPTEIH